MIRIGVTHDGFHAADDHVFDLCVKSLIGFDLLAGDGHRFDEFLVGNIPEVDEFFIEPFSVQFHNTVPP